LNVLSFDWAEVCLFHVLAPFGHSVWVITVSLDVLLVVLFVSESVSNVAVVNSSISVTTMDQIMNKAMR